MSQALTQGLTISSLLTDKNPQDKIIISDSNLFLNHVHTKTKGKLQPNDYCCRGNSNGSNDSGNQKSHQMVLCLLLEKHKGKGDDEKRD